MTSESNQGTTSDEARRPRPRVVGVVTSSKCAKTITVRYDYLVKHPMYGKYVRRHTNYKAHDPDGVAREGDKVEIQMTRPISRTKRWRLVRVIRQAAGA
jgi:small subunit ribosomal protein S17